MGKGYADVPLPPGAAVMASAVLATPKEDVEIIEVVPLRLDDGLRLVHSSVSWVTSSHARGIGTYPTAACTRRWPPKGYGPTRPAAGAALRPGDRASINLYLQSDTAEKGRADGIVITYRTKDGTFSQTSESLSARVWTDRSSPACEHQQGWFDDDIPASVGVPPAREMTPAELGK